jgi:hypothetical protein
MKSRGNNEFGRSEEFLMKFIDGLKIQIKLRVYERNPKTYDEALDIAIEAEDLLQRMGLDIAKTRSKRRLKSKNQQRLRTRLKHLNNKNGTNAESAAQMSTYGNTVQR